MIDELFAEFDGAFADSTIRSYRSDSSIGIALSATLVAAVAAVAAVAVCGY